MAIYLSLLFQLVRKILREHDEFTPCDGMYLSRLFRMVRKILTLSTRRTSRGKVKEKVI
jgi:hypothetical protein